MPEVTEADRAKLNRLYSDINNIEVPACTNIEAKDLAIKVGEGLTIIKQAIKEVANIIK